ncbi:MAG: hypothetical protein K2X35_19585 [Bryobacteraceae bacterium]|nr:hypothetical protein [Bryobacteraceae bacterium]
MTHGDNVYRAGNHRNSAGSALIVLTSIDGKATGTSAVGEKINAVFALGDRVLLEFQNRREGAILHSDGRVERIGLRPQAQLARGAGRKVFEIADGKAVALDANGQPDGSPAILLPLENPASGDLMEVNGKWMQLDRAEGALGSASGYVFRLTSPTVDAARARAQAAHQAAAARDPLSRHGTPLLMGDVAESPRGFLASLAGIRISEGALLVEFNEQGEVLREIRADLPNLGEKGRRMVPSEVVVVGNWIFVVDPAGEVTRYPYR